MDVCTDPSFLVTDFANLASIYNRHILQRCLWTVVASLFGRYGSSANTGLLSAPERDDRTGAVVVCQFLVVFCLMPISFHMMLREVDV